MSHDRKQDESSGTVALGPASGGTEGASSNGAATSRRAPSQDDRPTITLDPTSTRRVTTRPPGSQGEGRGSPPAPCWPLTPKPGAPWVDRLDPAVEGLPPRYTYGKEIGRGGQGRILTVFDTKLGRPVALKTILAGKNASQDAVSRIIHEVQITGQLEHPNIIPVYDIGQLATGDIFYTMRKVEGRSLADVIKGLAEGDEKTCREFSRVRLITVLLQICQGLAFAHDRQVVHRDLKPSNIMLGNYGEVTIMDWGCAKVRRASLSDTLSAVPRVTSQRQDDDWTLIGTVQGTPAYMSPEQAAGDPARIDHRSDIYAVGAILYEILTFSPPFEGTGDLEARLEAIQRDPVVPPRVKAAGRDIPEELEAVCLKCLAKNPDERYQTAHELYNALEAYLEGSLARERHRAEAEQIVRRGKAIAARYERLTRRVEMLRDRVDSLRKAIEPWEPIERKRRLWKAVKDLEIGEAHRIITFGEVVTALHQAISHDPENREAHRLLAELYWSQFLDAERRRDTHDMLYFEAMVREYGGERFEEALVGEGILSIASDPPDVEVVVWRYEEVDCRLQRLHARHLGKTPIRNIRLRPGSYLIELGTPETHHATVPVLMERQGKVTLNTRLVHPEDLGDHYVHVPAGPFLAGGDPRAPGGTPRALRWVDDFAISRYPVTYEEYGEFLNALRQRDPEQARARAPRKGLFKGYHWAHETERDDHTGGIELYHPRWPVFGISWHDAVAYCRWRSEVEGCEVRLPTEDEWEKAARGVDGRLFPWGDEFDPTFCKMWESRRHAAIPEPVGTFEADVSPYGVHDMAGCVSEWCQDWFNSTLELKLIKGGGWNATQNQCRLARRHGEHHRGVSPWVGFRVVRPLKLRSSPP